MIQKITSSRVELPPIFLIEDEEDFKALPRGLPFIIGKASELDFITIFLEFQVLYKSCLRTGISIKWLDCLRKIGYNIDNIRTFELNSGGEYWESCSGDGNKLTVDNFIEEQYLVDFDKLTELKILPVWLDDLRTSVEANIIDEVMFDPTAFNKQIGLNIGTGSVTHYKKNLLILDVSGSIPDSIVVTITNLAKLMSKRFYADIIITSGKTILIDYEQVPESDIVQIAADCGRNNEGEMYRKIVEEYKEYNTVIAFGDDDCPQSYNNGKELNPNFKIQTIYSLHTNNKSNNIVGYAKHLKADKVNVVHDWVHTINK